jgi:exopolysaccharide production protein ExoQ
MNSRSPIQLAKQPPAVGKLEKATTVALLIYFSDVLNGFGFLETVFATASYFVIPYLILRQWKRFLYFSVRDIPLLLLTSMAVSSLAWTQVFEDTLVTGRALVRITLFGIYFAMRYTLKEQLYLAAWAYGIATVMSLVSAPILPTGIIRGPGEVQGSFPHKNNAARAMVITAMTFLCIAFRSNRYRQVKWGGFILSVIHLLLTQGKTGLTVFIICMSLWPIRKVFKQNYLVRIPLVIFTSFVGIASFWWISGNYETILVQGLGKDLTLNGRTQLWVVLVQRIFEHPWFGYGYYGFWSSNRGQSSLLSEVEYGWIPTHAHNGFLDLALMLGFTGLILFCISFVITFARAIQFAAIGKTPDTYWPLLCLMVMILFNVTETITIISPTEITWILYISIALSLSAPREWVRKAYVSFPNEKAIHSPT